MRNICLIILCSILTAAPSRAVEFAIATGTANTSTGNTDYTVAGFGTPKCAIVFATYGTANGTAVSHAGVAIGATDGSAHGFLMGASEDNVATTDTGGAQNTIDTFRMVTQSAQSVTDGSANGTLISDGLRLNTADAFAAAYQLKVLLIGGAGIQGCKVGSVMTSSTLNASVTASTGFQSDVVLVWSMADSSSAPNNNGLCAGVYVRDGSNTQYAMCMNDSSAQASSALFERLAVGYVAKRVVNGISGPGAEIGNVTTTGFDVTSKDSVSTTILLHYLAIDLSPTVSAKLVTNASPTSTGSEAITGVGFKPQFAFGMYGSVLANDTHYTDGDAESWGLGLMTASVSACLGIASDDNVSPSNTESLTDSKAICMRKDAALFQEATLTSFDSNGMTLNHGTVNGSSRRRIILFVQEGAVSGSTRNRAGLFLP